MAYRDPVTCDADIDVLKRGRARAIVSIIKCRATAQLRNGAPLEKTI